MEKKTKMENLIETTDYLLKRLREKGADDIVLSASSGVGQQLKFANNKIVKTGMEALEGINIFSAWDNRIIETTLKEPTEEQADKVVNNLVKFSRYVPKNKNYCGIAKGPFRYKKLPYDKRIIELGERTVEIIEDAVSSAIKVGSKRSSGILEVADYEHYLVTSNNVSASDRGSHVYFSIRSFVDKFSSGHRVLCGRKLGGMDFEKTAKEAAMIAKSANNPTQGPTGKFDVLFEPMPFANILEHVGESASMFQVEAGFSFLQGLLNKTVANEAVTIIDDGTLPKGYHSSPFDSEGVPTRKNTIIEKGKLKMYLHNTSTAKRYNTETTGNAGLIAPHPWNVVLKEGKVDKEDMVRELGDGVYITNVWYTRFQNYVKGDFSTIPRDGAFLVKNGEITQSIKNIRVSENMVNILKNIKVIGKDTENIHSWEISSSVITPSVIVKDVNITRPVS